MGDDRILRRGLRVGRSACEYMLLKNLETGMESVTLGDKRAELVVPCRAFDSKCVRASP